MIIIIKSFECKKIKLSNYFTMLCLIWNFTIFHYVSSS